MKAVVTGAGGQLGQALVANPPADGEVVGVPRASLNIADPVAVADMLRRLRPDVVVNAAAYTAVDRAETEPEAARRVNAEAPGVLASACRGVGARLVHVSTDFVFDGGGGAPLTPESPTEPLSVYGATKLEGERRVQDAMPDALVVRTAWVCSAHGRNFMNTMLRLMRERGEVRVVCDQFGTPTFAGDLAQAIWGLVGAGASGIRHWTQSGTASWYDFAEAIRREGQNRDLLGTEARVVPISTEEFPTPARRPRFSVLDCSLAYTTLGVVARHWQDALAETLAEVARVEQRKS